MENDDNNALTVLAGFVALVVSTRAPSLKQIKENTFTDCLTLGFSKSQCRKTIKEMKDEGLL